MIKVYAGKQSLAVFLLFILGLIVFLSLFFWGITKIIQLFLPLLVVLSYLLIIVFTFAVVPMTYFKFMRPVLSVYALVMSYALGAATWIMSFFIVLKAFGILGIFFILAFKLMAPIALLGAVFKGSWHIAAHLALWISFTYGMKYYSQWLSNLNARAQEKGSIIDVDAIEIRGHSKI